MLVIGLVACVSDQLVEPPNGPGGVAVPRDPADTTDTTAPAVSEHLPIDGETHVPITAAVAVAFTEDLDTNTVTTESFFLTGPSGRVRGTVVVRGSGATFNATDPLLEFSTEYTWTLTTDIRDEAGHSLAADYTASFTTVLADPSYYYRLTNQQIGDTVALSVMTPADSTCMMSNSGQSPGQSWRLIEHSETGEYVLVNRSGGSPQLLDGGDGVNPCHVGPSGQTGPPDAGQLWTLSPEGVPFYRFQTRDFGNFRSLDVDAAGAPVMAPTGDVRSQVWKLQRLGGIN
jgi:hypothetical protein